MCWCAGLCCQGAACESSSGPGGSHLQVLEAGGAIEQHDGEHGCKRMGGRWMLVDGGVAERFALCKGAAQGHIGLNQSSAHATHH